MGSTQGAIRSWRRWTRGVATRESAAMATMRRIAMPARLILPWMLIAAAPRHAVMAAEAADDSGAVIAFCRPLQVEGQPAAASQCICSVEQLECALTGGEFLSHIATLRAAGALGAAEFAAAASQGQRVCGPAVASASLADPQTRSGRAPGSWAADMAAPARRAGQP